ncbi:GTP cyclohydrolase I FolE2 [Streptomyces sp. 3MP-14]|uniref:GTP cyclohydrolase I FolE2 n=1 Tax=Streptomyces mimosae TaxID=2586635 RepID=A0A5N6ARK6_9ACTN|nr:MULTISPECIES: GTP cyclohydrolase, FolE2/MptA family [Streptomyces]KAB8170805.1 GTP cyclohydrolase I FolE2 [Streptomyces mimosae]KAB8179842.1 GTP cyclohydrolase I FolE2 [Streptomyces sp. 3MP-14]
MHDIQNETDSRGIEIEEVGISALRYPLYFEDGHLRQEGIAEIEVTVRLQRDRRGTHMSRMVALAHDHLRRFDPRRLPNILKIGVDLLDAPAIAVTIDVSLSTTTIAPASGQESCRVHDVRFEGRWDDGDTTVNTSVTTEVTSLCPCSKAISDYGAHNQRSRVKLSVIGHGDNPYPLGVQEAVRLLEGCASAPVVPLVKRPDERVLTMQAYDHPMFVEDMARDVSRACRERGLVHAVSARNLESIHSHDAVARVSG